MPPLMARRSPQDYIEGFKRGIITIENSLNFNYIEAIENKLKLYETFSTIYLRYRIRVKSGLYLELPSEYRREEKSW